jgi:transcriptional regulator with XRE-family HTH domain
MLMDITLLGKSIKEKRKQLNLTQEKFAELLEVSTHYVYEIERGTKTPSLPVLITIAELLNTTIDNLLTGESDKNINKEYDKLDVLINSLSPAKRKEVYDMLCFLLPKMNF